jgi:Cd2+/Zn2+-exporting ATPase
MADPLDRDPSAWADTDCCAPEGSAEERPASCASACTPTPCPTGSEGAGRPAAPPRYSFDVQGLCCAQEVGLLKQEVGPVVGGADKLAFDVLKGRMMVLQDAGEVSADTVRRAVRRTGMTATDAHSGDAETGRTRQHRMQTLLTALSGAFLVLGVSLQMTVVPADAPLPWFVIAAYALSVGCGGRYVGVKAVYAAKLLRADINLLMVIAVAGAIAIGEWFEAATVAFLFALSLLLESWSVARARRAVEALLDLAPQTVRLCAADGSEPVVDAGTVAVGSRFVVKPGERIPLDGVVQAGTSWVDQAPITGESRPVAKQVGSTVYAGTINSDGALEVESSKPHDDTTLSKIIRMVGEAHGKRARAEQFVERFARVYTPVVLGVALAVALVAPLVAGGAWADWLYRALVLLVIACPCALVISTPVSIVAALASSARQGVLIKGGSYVEQPARLRAVAFDKTGTLTRGTPAVATVDGVGDWQPADVLRVAAALEGRSAHPLARAIQDHARDRGIDPAPAADVQAAQGKGLTGTVDGQAYWLGSHRQLLAHTDETPGLRTRLDALEGAGQTVVVLGRGEEVCGLIALADTPRPGSRQALADLRAHGVERLVMLTGDNAATARAIAEQVGVDEVRAELLPADKLTAVEELVARYGTVAMVGDGVNDAPAMARASFGVAMGAVGSDAAIETADVALMTDDLSRLPWLVAHGRRTVAVIQQNIVFALALKAVFVVLTFAGAATLWGAIAADVGAALLVVANALRLLRPTAGPTLAPAAPAPAAPAASS